MELFIRVNGYFISIPYYIFFASLTYMYMYMYYMYYTCGLAFYMHHCQCLTIESSSESSRQALAPPLQRAT